MTNKALHAFQFVTDDAPKSIFGFFKRWEMMKTLKIFFFLFLENENFVIKVSFYDIFEFPSSTALRFSPCTMTACERQQQKAIVILLWYLNSILSFHTDSSSGKEAHRIVSGFCCLFALASLEVIKQSADFCLSSFLPICRFPKTWKMFVKWICCLLLVKMFRGDIFSSKFFL